MKSSILDYSSYKNGFISYLSLTSTLMSFCALQKDKLIALVYTTASQTQNIWNLKLKPFIDVHSLNS